MSSPMTASEADLCRLAAIVTAKREDLPAHGLPPSLLADLMDQIRCDVVTFQGVDSGRQDHWFSEDLPEDDGIDGGLVEAANQAFWQHYWDSAVCSYPDRAGDLRSVVKIADFYSARQWRSTGIYADVFRPQRIQHILELSLPEPPGPSRGPGRTVRLLLFRFCGPDFSERDRALLTLIRPHLYQAYLDAERRRAQGPGSPRGRPACCGWSRTGTPTPRSPGAWACPRAPCAPTWSTSTKGCRSPAAPPRCCAPSPTR